jgi:hypothetical protein
MTGRVRTTSKKSLTERRKERGGNAEKSNRKAGLRPGLYITET